MTTSRKVIVIGGGAIGLCAAHELRTEGFETVLLDRGDRVDGCSVHNAGLIVPSHFVPLAAPGVMKQGLRWMLDPESPFYVKPRLDPALVSWIWRFHRSSTREHVHRSMILLRDLGQAGLAGFTHLQQLEGMNFGLIRKGLLMLFRTEGGRASCVEESKLARGIGVEAEVLEAGELQKLEPNISFSAAGGVYFPGDAHLSPSLFFEQMTRLVQREGTLMDHSTEVLGFEHFGGQITGVRTSSGLHEADSFIVAGGAWSSTLLRGLDLRLPLQAGKGYSVTVDHPPKKPAIPLILTESRVAVTPFPESIRLAGTMELAGNDLSINGRRVNALLKAASRYVPDIELPPLHEIRPWAGLRPCSPDGLPYIGRFNAFQNLIVATGHAMLGITMAPATGKLVADLVTGRSITLDMQWLSPDRFNRG